MVNSDLPQARLPDRSAAFVDLVNHREASLLAFVRHRLRSGSLAIDIVQQTFLKAWANKEFDPSHANATSYLFKTAANLVVDWLRSSESGSISLDNTSAGDSLVLSLLDPTARDPLAKMIVEEEDRSLATALSMLSVEHRDVLERYYVRQEGTQFQIAAVMGLSVAALNSRLNKARIELKQILSVDRSAQAVPRQARETAMTAGAQQHG